MNKFPANEHVKLKLKIAGQGVQFLFHRFASEGDPLVEVDQSWSSVHALVARLRKDQLYCAKDRPLLVWKRDEVLHIKFYIPDLQATEECTFSPEETARILRMLEKLPSLN